MTYTSKPLFAFEERDGKVCRVIIGAEVTWQPTISGIIRDEELIRHKILSQEIRYMPHSPTKLEILESAETILNLIKFEPQLDGTMHHTIHYTINILCDLIETQPFHNILESIRNLYPKLCTASAPIVHKLYYALGCIACVVSVGSIDIEDSLRPEMAAAVKGFGVVIKKYDAEFEQCDVKTKTLENFCIELRENVEKFQDACDVHIEIRRLSIRTTRCMSKFLYSD